MANQPPAGIERPRDMEGRVAIITGACGGLGKSLCDEFEARGAILVKVDIEGDDCVQFDMGRAEGCEGLVRHAVDLHGRIDILILNAGIQHVAPIAEFPEDRWDALHDIYVKGPFLTIKAAWPHLIARPGGRILVTASTSSYFAEPYKAAYIAAKHGVLGLIKVAALEGGPHGLTANAVAPAWMDTPGVTRQLEEQARLRQCSEQEVLEIFLSRQPVKRFVRTQEVAATFGFLASSGAAAITGACVPVDLGLMAW